MSQLVFLICRTYLITLMTNGGDFQSLYHTGNIQWPGFAGILKGGTRLRCAIHRGLLQKHGAVCQFEAAEGRFCLELVL